MMNGIGLNETVQYARFAAMLLNLEPRNPIQDWHQFRPEFLGHRSPRPVWTGRECDLVNEAFGHSSPCIAGKRLFRPPR